MKIKTYDFITNVPLIGLVAKMVCRPVMLCSPGLDDKAYDDLLRYMQEHPDILMTERLADEIRRKRKQTAGSGSD